MSIPIEMRGKNNAEAGDLETIAMYSILDGRGIYVAKSPDMPDHTSIIIAYENHFAQITLTPGEREILIQSIKETA